MPFAITRPSPVPPGSGPVRSRLRKNLVKSWRCSSAVMPRPVSCTTTSTAPYVDRALDAHAPGPRVLERVRDEVPEDLDEPVAVAHDLRQGGQVLLEGEPAAIRLDPEGGGHVAEDGHEVDELPAELHPARLDLGDVQEIVDQRAQPVGALGRDLEEALLEIGHRPRLALEDELDVAPERGQRGSELVRDRGDELVLHPLDRLPVGHVAHDHHERAAAVGGHGADRQLGGKPRSVRPHALDLGPRRRARRGGAGELEAREDDRDGPAEQRGGRLAEHRLRRGVRRGDQAAPVGRHDPVLGGVDDPPQLTGHARQILGAQRRRIPATGQRRRQSTVPDGDGRQAGEPAQAVQVDRRRPGRPRGQTTTSWPATSSSTTTGRLISPACGGLASVGSRSGSGAPPSVPARAMTRETPRAGSCTVTYTRSAPAISRAAAAMRVRAGPTSLDAPRARVAAASASRSRCARARPSGSAAWHRFHPQTLLTRCSGLAAPFGPTRSRRASTARRRGLATTR